MQDSEKLHARAELVDNVMAVLTELSFLPFTANHQIWGLNPPSKTLQTHVYQQTKKTEYCEALGEGSTNMVKRSWEKYRNSRRAETLLLGRRQEWRKRHVSAKE